jgi:hypothetical protein
MWGQVDACTVVPCSAAWQVDDGQVLSTMTIVSGLLPIDMDRQQLAEEYGRRRRIALGQNNLADRPPER